jgi:hypothetical protein
LLLWILDRHEAHRRPPHSLADRFGISRVVLVALHVWFYVARRHQAHVMPERGDLTGPKVRSPARFHPHQTGWHGSKKGYDLATAQAPAQNNFPGSINPCSWKTCFEMSIPMVISLMDGSLCW